MNKNLLTQVDAVKLDALNEALLEVTQDMRQIDRTKCLSDEDYGIMLDLNLRVVSAIRKQVLEITQQKKVKTGQKI